MKETISSTFILLLTLTVIAAFLALNVSAEIMTTTVVTLALIKFWLVAFQFMELKKAHSFWKYLILGFGGLMGVILVILLRDKWNAEINKENNMTLQKNTHTFHIPVMGLAFTIDSPVRVAQYGIDSVISIMDDRSEEHTSELQSHHDLV